ncbi:MAG: hypothetical protein D6775_04705 [Caldilineae bacterium]|nr:MAG: hypothetical protein D6775_04705 [Caldilineae bacterium]
MNQPLSPEVRELAQQARQVHARLEELWADEGVDQLSIFLDPDIYSVLSEIKELSLNFIRQVAALAGD